MQQEIILSRNFRNSPLNSIPLNKKDNNEIVSKELNKRLIDTVNTFITYYADYTKHDKSILPNNFEPQNNIWKERLVDAIDQGKCGSCWSYAASGCLTDRFNILCGEKYFDSCLSVTDQIYCNNFLKLLFNNNEYENMYIKTLPNICDGNNLILAFLYLKYVGISSDICIPYVSNKYNKKIISTYFGIDQSLDEWGKFSSFEHKQRDLLDYSEKEKSVNCTLNHPYSEQRPYSYCNNVYQLSNKYYGSPKQNFFSLFNYSIYNGDVDADMIRYDIYRWGPVGTSFYVYDDFYEFDPIKDGVYIYKENASNKIQGGHSVEIVGWGVYNDIPFWWIKNSWGKNYGFNGYFRFLRGKNQCQIEYNVISLLPNLFVDFSNKSQVNMLSNWITKESNIFYVNTKNKELYSRTQTIFKIFKSELTFFNEDIFKKLWDDTFNQYPIFGFEILRQSGFLQYFENTRCGYTIQALITLPYLYYSCPNYNLPIHPNYFAGLLNNNTKTIKNPSWILLILICLLMLIICILWTCIYTRIWTS